MSRLYDFLRVVNGASLVAKTSLSTYARQNRYATSHLTVYPASPFDGAATVATSVAKTLISTVQNVSTKVTTGNNNSNNANAPDEAMDIDFQELSPDPNFSDFQPIVYYNTFGNSAPTPVNQFFNNSHTTTTVDGIPITQKPTTNVDAIPTPSLNETLVEQNEPEITADDTIHTTDVTVDDHQPQKIEESIATTITPVKEQVITTKFINENALPKEEQKSVDQMMFTTSKVELRERAIPSSSFGRATHFAGLGAKLMYGTMSEVLKRTFGQRNQEDTTAKPLYSPVINEHNAEALADALCKMRGAALKLGQMLSIQDETIVPPVIQKALEKVRQSAYVMPRRQLEGVLSEELGNDWAKHFKEFDMKPIAAASIGQVHKGVLQDGREVAIKVQYPRVKESIDSDVRNLMNLVSYTNLLPRGAYIADTMKQARKELHMECDYEKEAEHQRKFKKLVQESIEEENMRIAVEGSKSYFDPPMSIFYVPDVISELSTKRVLTTELVSGTSIENVSKLSVEQRAHVARLLLKLCLKELFEFRFMQTDPNWANFFYDGPNRINLIDFGACLEFPKYFVDEYIRVVHASAIKDKDTIIDASIKMGFLTGDETDEMKEAHAKAAMIVGEPFSKPGIYDFKSHAMPEKVSQTIPTMLKGRLTPPPPVTYSLHRKLSGAFLLCYKLGAAIECQDIFQDIYDRYQTNLAQETIQKQVKL